MKKLNSIKSKLILMLITTIAFCFAAICVYYLFVLNLIRDREEVYVRNSVNQIVQNIQTSTDDMMRFARIASTSNATQDFLTSSDPLARLENSRDVSNSLFSITQDHSEIAILIMETNGAALAPKPLLSVIDTLESDYLNLHPEKNSGFTGVMRNAYDGINYFAYYYPILDIKNDVQLQRQIGSCIVLKSLNELQKCISLAETTPHSLFYILDSNGESIVSNQSRNDDTTKELLPCLQATTPVNGAVQSINGSRHMILFQEVPFTGWLVVGAVPLNEIDSELTSLLISGMIGLIFLGLLFGFWDITIFRSVALPVLEISKFLQGDAYSRLHKRLYLKNRNEIGALAEQINQMLDKISEMTHTIFLNHSNMYELDLARKRAELSALQSQINPHFLYNTLDCIKGYGYLLNNNEIVQITDSLAQIMRYCIKGSDIVPLSDELNIVQQYLSIISIRFDNRFLFTIDIPENIQALRIPRFILQPIVENAVYHGLEPKYDKGILRIYSLESPNILEICIQDNGVGISQDILDELHNELSRSNAHSLFEGNNKKNLALLNVNQRICQFFGEEYGLSLESVPDEGTLVRLYIPRDKLK
ncbi:MAG: histidine kinase [Eubacteriales bacterium]|nr:histidine kinase [Eubacteriales bacterium]